MIARKHTDHTWNHQKANNWLPLPDAYLRSYPTDSGNFDLAQTRYMHRYVGTDRVPNQYEIDYYPSGLCSVYLDAILFTELCLFAYESRGCFSVPSNRC